MLDFICRRIADLEKRMSVLPEMEQRILQRVDQNHAAVMAELKRIRETAAPVAEKRPMLVPLAAAAPSVPWPVQAPQSEEPAIPDLCRNEGGTAGQVILLVDDDAMVRQVTSGMLTKAGYTVDSASSGEAALRAMEEDAGRYGVVLLDLAMPGMNGEQTFRRFRQQQWEIPVIFYSGYGYQLAELFARYGGKKTEFLQKPFEPAQLIDRVKRQLAASHQAAASGEPAEQQQPAEQQPVDPFARAQALRAATVPVPVPLTDLAPAPPAVTAAVPPVAVPPPIPLTGPVPPAVSAA